MIKKLLTGALAGLFSMGAFAWQPTKPVTVIIAYGPGSGNEILIRKLDSIITRTNKINFVLEFIQGIEKEISEMKLNVINHARVSAGFFVNSIANNAF